MQRDFPESDWKVLSRLKPLALDRLCRRILDEAQALIANVSEGKSHQAYLALYRYIDQQDRVMADCFNDWSRSNALIMLLLWRRHGLVTEEEYAAFSEETRQRVNLLANLDS